MNANILILFVISAINFVKSQHPSPCTEIFQYIPEDSKPGKWTGRLNINSEFPLSGAWIKIVLDRKIQNVQSKFGEVLITNNKEFLIKDGNYNLIPGSSLTFPISISYLPDEPIPNLVAIRLNGRTICPANKGISQEVSKCPGVFSYNKDKEEEGVWYGTLILNTEFELTGVWIRIVLNHPAELLINEFGDIRTIDNTQYLISNRNYTLMPEQPLRIPIWVKYSPNGELPLVQTVRLNGRTVCGQIISEDNNK